MDLGTGGLHKLGVNQGVVTMVTVVEWFIWAPETNSIRKPERELLDYLTTIISTTEHLMCEGKSPDSSLDPRPPPFFVLQFVFSCALLLLFIIPNANRRTKNGGGRGTRLT